MKRALAMCVLVALAAAACGAQERALPQRNEPRAVIDPRAQELLDRCAAAYRDLPMLDQVTTFYGATIPLDPAAAAQLSQAQGAKVGEETKLPRTTHLQVGEGNRVRLEMLQSDPGASQPTVRLWDSDGRSIWTWNSEDNRFTQEPAPKRRRDLGRARTMTAGTIELLMMFGTNPFTNLKDAITEARVLPQQTVNGVRCDTVLLRSVTLGGTIDMTLCMGTDDSLIRRLIVDTTPPQQTEVATSGPRPAGDALDALLDDAPRHPQLPSTVSPEALANQRSQPQIRTHMRCDNTVTLPATFPASTFQYTPPANAQRFIPTETSMQALHQNMEDQVRSILQRMGRTPPKHLHVVHP